MMSLVQSLPVELIDLIIDYVEADVNFVDPESNRRTHSCQCLGCDIREFDHNENLLNFSQVCSQFRKQAIPRLWSNYIVSMQRFSITERLLQRTEDKQIYFQHVKQLFVANVPLDALGLYPRYSYWWLWADEDKPFGVHIHDVQNKWFPKEARILSSLLRKCIKWVMEGRVRFIEFLDESTTLNSMYFIGELLPFWLCVTNPKSNSIPAKVISQFKRNLSRNKGKHKKMKVDDKFSIASAMIEREREPAEIITTNDIIAFVNSLYFSSLSSHPCMCMHVQYQLENNFRPPKSELFNRAKEEFSVPFWLRNDSQKKISIWLQEMGFKFREDIESGKIIFTTIKGLLETTYTDGDDWSDWLASNVFAKAEWTLPESEGLQLAETMVAQESLRDAIHALRNDWDLRKQVLAFYENGWKTPMKNDGTTSDTMNVNDDDDDDDNDNNCIVM